MVLHAEGGQAAMPQALDRLVVEVQVRDFQFVGQRIGLNGETVILRSDFHPATLMV